MRNRLIRAGVVFAALAILATAPAARADGWGSVKGQVIWDGVPPVPEKLKVDKDQGECEKHGPLMSQKYVVDPTTKGVRWVAVWLVDPKNSTKALQTAPALKEIKEKKISLDQPTCQFEPHLMFLRQGQSLSVKNTAKMPHNIKIDGGNTNPNLNQIVAPGSILPVGASGFKASMTPVSLSCTIHGWMKGYLIVVNHPYYAVTDAQGNFEIKDAPAGTWNLVVWQEEKGWLNGDKKGKPVEIKDGGTTEVKIDVKP
jgi:plastocyanin